MNLRKVFDQISPLTIFAALALTAAAVIAVTAHAAPGAAPAPTGAQHIGVANVSHIFNDMQETKDLKEKLEARRQELTNQEKEKGANIKEMQDHLLTIKPDHPQYKEELEKLDKAMAEMDSWGKVVRLEAEREQKMTMKTLFSKIRDAVAEVAREQGYDLVLADQTGDFPDIEKNNFEQLRGYISQQNVLYASKGADISESVLTQLDAQYAKGKGSK